MNILPRGKAMVLITACTLATAGCVVRERTVYAAPPGADASSGGEVVSEAPPLAVEETVTLAPGPGFVWIGGVWVWGGGGWRWEAGHWARPPRPGAVWVPHRYVYRGGRHVWIRGGWR